MKTKTKDIPVEVGNVQERGEFRIKTSAVAFSILSSGLYSNKYKAILRELGCNAYDSHIEAGKPDLPFTVHLPTRLNPIFSVKDYGIGLDHDEVMGLYTTYFESTKQDSNDYVGCMGLGSKSPFSYTKNFTITAIKDGWKGVYSAFIGELGVPSIVQLTGEDTDEDNGVEVSFAVENSSDMRQFSHEAKNVYKWFTIKPEITGDSCDIPEIEYSDIDIIPGTSIRKDSYFKTSYAIMGNVAYPIKIPSGEEISEEIRNLYDNNGLVVTFKIGDFDIAASREELSYIPHTIESLVNKGEEILAALGKHVQKRLKPCKTKWERTKAACKLIDSNNNLFGVPVERYVEKYPKQFARFVRRQYNNISMILPRSELDKIKGLRYSFRQKRRKGYSGDFMLGTIKSETQRKSNAKRNKHGIYDPNNFYHVYTITPTEQTFIFADERGSVPNRLRMAFDDPNFKDMFTSNIAIFSPKNKDVDKDKIFKRLRTLFGNPNVILASSLPSPLKVQRNGNGNKKITIQRFAERRTSRWAQPKHSFDPVYEKIKNITPTVVKGKKNIYLYLPLSHKSIIKPFTDTDDPTWTATTIKGLIINGDIAKMAGIDIDKVYGVGKTSFKAIRSEKNWLNFFDYIEQKFNEIDWKAAGVETELELIRAQFVEYETKLAKITPAMIARFAKTKTPFGAVAKEWRDMINRGKIVQKHNTGVAYDKVIRAMKILCPEMNFSAVGPKLDPEKIEKRFEKLFTRMKKTYPMLTHLDLDNDYRNHNHWDQAIQYIKLVDSVKK